MIEEFAKQLVQNYRLRKDQTFLLACSGGVDSVVLAHLFQQLDYSFSLAYCNFKLRVPACDAEAVFVQKLGKKLGKPVHVKTFKTAQHAKETKVSIQMAARNLRYTWFDQLLQENEYCTLVTAHHADDQLETLLLNLGRGNGPSGLTGIPTQTSNRLRPLLSFSKSEIIHYAHTENLEWCEDESNAKNDYLRNALRNEILPRWEKHQPQLRKNLAKSIQHIQQANRVLQNEVERFKNDFFVEKDHVIHLPVRALSNVEDPSFYLHHIYYPFGFENTTDLKQLLDADTGKQLFSKTHRLLKNREELLLSSLPKGKDQELYWDGVQPLHFPVCLHSSDVEGSEAQILLDREKLKFPLKLRKMKEGDYFYPSGMQGKKKLSKFFKDEKYSMLEKENQWLLCSGDQIVWIIGKRSDRRFLQTPETQQLFCISTK